MYEHFWLIFVVIIEIIILVALIIMAKRIKLFELLDETYQHKMKLIAFLKAKTEEQKEDN